MPILDVANANPFVDGRQSERAMRVRLGVERYFGDLNWACLPELTLKSGRRADLIALSPKGLVTIIEVKSSVADFRADQKWPDYHEFCDEFLFATLSDVPAEIFPLEAGLMIADDYGAEILRPSEQNKMQAARRKTVHLAFARASALRLSRLCAHAGVDGSQFAGD